MIHQTYSDYIINNSLFLEKNYKIISPYSITTVQESPKVYMLFVENRNIYINEYHLKILEIFNKYETLSIKEILNIEFNISLSLDEKLILICKFLNQMLKNKIINIV